MRKRLISANLLNVKPTAPSRANSAFPTALDSIIIKSLEKDRERRYQRAADLCSDLKRAKAERKSQLVTSASPGVKAKAQSARS